MTDPATEIKSVGLPADAQLAAFFALPLIKYTLIRNLLPSTGTLLSRQLYHDMTTPNHLPGLAKNSPTLMQSATNQTAHRYA